MLEYRVIEKTFRSRSVQLQAGANPAEMDLITASRRKIVNLYGQILEFQIRMAYCYSRRGLNRYMRDLVTSDDWQGMQAFIDASHKAIQKYLDILGHVHLDNALEAQQSQFQQFSKRSMLSLNALNIELDESRNDQLLRTISYIGDAAYNSYENQRHRLGLADTRVDLLRNIKIGRLAIPNQYIFWLRGLAGAGKSTIALTIAQSLDGLGISLASFSSNAAVVTLLDHERWSAPLLFN